MDDPRTELAGLLIPTILIRGECDWVDPEVVGQYHLAFPYLQTTRIENDGRALHLETPDIVREVILELLRE